MTDIEKAFKLIEEERAYQNRKWGGKDHDKDHNLSDWIAFMEHCTTSAKLAVYNDAPADAVRQIIKATTLGVACLEQQNLITPKE